MSKTIWKSFIRYFAGVWEDYMLVACILAPIFMGLVFRYGIIALEAFLCKQFQMAEIIVPYYQIFDLLLAIMTPVMFSFSGVMTVLEELDNGTTRYLVVTPLGKAGYLMSRIGMQSLLSIIYALVILLIFGISDLKFFFILMISLLCSICGIISSMLIIAYAKNRVEGMALIKLSGLFIIGIPVAYFVSSKLSFLCGILPSFWIAKLAQEQTLWFIIPTVLSLLVWISLFYRKFKQRLF